LFERWTSDSAGTGHLRREGGAHLRPVRNPRNRRRERGDASTPGQDSSPYSPAGRTARYLSRQRANKHRQRSSPQWIFFFVRRPPPKSTTSKPRAGAASRIRPPGSAAAGGGAGGGRLVCSAKGPRATSRPERFRPYRQPPIGSLITARVPDRRVRGLGTSLARTTPLIPAGARRTQSRGGSAT